MEKKKILIVDNERDILTLLGKRLSARGFSVMTAENGSDAINLAKSKRPDLIILDIMMPEMDGAEVSARLQEDSKTSSIPIIFLTCLFTKKEEREKGHIIGGRVFIAKPYRIEELLKEVESLL